MSQTSLASAIRRRTKNEIVAKTTQGNIPIPPHKKNLQNLPSQQQNQPLQSTQNNSSITDTQATSPLMLLLQHKQLINELQGEIMELKEAKNRNMNNPSEIEYYKKQYETLLNEFSEIKKVLVKVQTFSMETNLEMLQLKRLLKQNNIEVPPSSLKESTEQFLNEDDENLEQND
jgi:hypothetical protein